MSNAEVPIPPSPTPESVGYDEIVMPALLGDARRTYGVAMRRALLDAGFDDVPRRGMGVVGGIARNGPAPQGDLVRFLGMSKQGASQLVDTLVTRGYIDRLPQPEDRRRMVLTLTPRGEDAATVSAAAVDRVDRAVAAQASPEELATVRRVLGLVITLGDEARERRQRRLD